MIKKNWRKYLPLIGIILFVYIISRLELKDFYELLTNIDYKYLFILPITIIIIFILQTVRWKMLLKIQDIKVKFSILFKIQLIGNYYAIITPSRLGYFLKIPYLNNYVKNSSGKIALSIIFDRILDVLILFMLAFVGSLMLIGQYPYIFTILLLLTLFFLLIAFVFSRKKRAKFILSFTKKIIPIQFQDKLAIVFHEFYDNLLLKKLLISPLIITFALWWIVVSQSYLVALAFNINVNYWIFIFLFPIATVVSLLPISVAGLGTREATLILIFSLYNVSSESLVAMSLIGMILGSYLPSLLGLILSFNFVNQEIDKN